MPRFVIASSNGGKLREMGEILAGSNFEFVPQSAFAVPEVAETGVSFVENALIKARHASLHTGLPAISDDSGLAVDALEGAPGICSARYAGPQASDRDNLEKLLGALRGVPKEARRARFHCVMTLVRHPVDPVPLIFHGVWEGEISKEPHGDNGFGYDPIFQVAGFDCTAAELEPKMKNRLSHRAQVLNMLAATLRAQYHE